MPLVKISLRKGRSPDYKRAILDGIHSGLFEAFRIPDHDRHQQVYELNRNPPGNSYRVVRLDMTGIMSG